MTTKQRAYLRSVASTYSPLMQIGKDVLKEESIKQIEDMLDARELVKIKVLKNCELVAKEVAVKVSEKTGCEIIQVIGNTIVLYRFSKRDKVKHIEIKC